MNNNNAPATPVQNVQPGNAFINKPISQLHTFYLTGTIGEAAQYITWFEILRNAGENDVIQIHINSYGGDLFTTIQFMRAIADSNAHVVCSVEGACMSAATMIFLSADSFEVSEHSIFMFHNYSSGTFGKGGEMYDNIVHERKWSGHLLNRVYGDFLDKDEINSLLDNKDIWMDGEEVLKRLKIKFDKLNKKQNTKAPAKKPTAKKQTAKAPAAKAPAAKAPAKKPAKKSAPAE